MRSRSTEHRAARALTGTDPERRPASRSPSPGRRRATASGLSTGLPSSIKRNKGLPRAPAWSEPVRQAIEKTGRGRLDDRGAKSNPGATRERFSRTALESSPGEGLCSVHRRTGGVIGIASRRAHRPERAPNSPPVSAGAGQQPLRHPKGAIAVPADPKSRQVIRVPETARWYRDGKDFTV